MTTDLARGARCGVPLLSGAEQARRRRPSTRQQWLVTRPRAHDSTLPLRWRASSFSAARSPVPEPWTRSNAATIPATRTSTTRIRSHRSRIHATFSCFGPYRIRLDSEFAWFHSRYRRPSGCGFVVYGSRLIASRGGGTGSGGGTGCGGGTGSGGDTGSGGGGRRDSRVAGGRSRSYPSTRSGTSHQPVPAGDEHRRPPAQLSEHRRDPVVLGRARRSRPHCGGFVSLVPRVVANWIRDVTARGTRTDLFLRSDTARTTSLPFLDEASGHARRDLLTSIIPRHELSGSPAAEAAPPAFGKEDVRRS
jgi:hypothetical protein